MALLGQGQAHAEGNAPGAGTTTGSMAWSPPPSCEVPPCAPTTVDSAWSGTGLGAMSIPDEGQTFTGLVDMQLYMTGTENAAVGEGTVDALLSGSGMWFQGRGTYQRVGSIAPIVVSGWLCINGFCVSTTLIIWITVTATATVTINPTTVTLSASASFAALWTLCVGPRPPC